MLEITNLSVSINEQSILHNINLAICPGQVHAIMGPNGSGKSTLAYALMGHPQYSIAAGSIFLDQTDITTLSPAERARLGLFLAFQQPPSIPGVNILTFLKEAHQAITKQILSITDFKKLILGYMQQLHISPSFVERSLNDGFSGGEKKQFEMLQVLLLKPSIVILDEIDSGLDIDALKNVSHGLQYVREQNPNMCILLITHYQRILDYIQPDVVHVLYNGSIVTSGDAQLVNELERKGYDGYRIKEQQS
jgi:Fe-S cluster assembly ATP-binding protein